MSIVQRILRSSVTQLTRAAAVFALIGLAAMAISVVYPKPLPVVLAMSAGHGIGALAVACYGLAIILDAVRSDKNGPPPALAEATDQPSNKPETQ